MRYELKIIKSFQAVVYFAALNGNFLIEINVFISCIPWRSQ